MTAQPQARPEDVARWRALVNQALAASAGLASTPAPGLDRACTAAKRAVVPSGALDARNPFVRLQRTARRYMDGTTRDRRDLQVELGELARVCAAELGDPDGAPPVPAPPACRLPYREDD